MPTAAPTLNCDPPLAHLPPCQFTNAVAKLLSVNPDFRSALDYLRTVCASMQVLQITALPSHTFCGPSKVQSAFQHPLALYVEF
jgi:hypothetical protein